MKMNYRGFSSAKALICLLAFFISYPAVSAKAPPSDSPASSYTTTDNQTLRAEIATKVKDNLLPAKFNKSNIEFTVYNTSNGRNVLITGQVPDRNIKREVFKIIKNYYNNIKIDNYLEIKKAQSMAERANDGGTTALIRTKLVNPDFDTKDIKIVTTNKIVYVAGFCPREQEGDIIKSIKDASGGKAVINLLNK